MYLFILHIFPKSSPTSKKQEIHILSMFSPEPKQALVNHLTT